MSWLNEFDAAQRQRTENNTATSTSNDESQKSSIQENATSATSLHFNKQQNNNNNNKEDLVGEIILTYKDRTDRNNTKSNSDKLFDQFVSSNIKNTKNNNDFDEDEVELEDEELRQMLDQRVLRRRQEIQLRGGKSSEHPSNLEENKNNHNTLKKSKAENENNIGDDEFGALDDQEEEKLRHMQNLRMKLMATRQRDGLAKEKQQILSSSASQDGNSKKNSNAFFGDFDEDASITAETKTTKQNIINSKNVAKPKFNFSLLLVGANKKSEGNGNNAATSDSSNESSSSSSILQKQRMFAQKKKFLHDQQEESLKSMEGFDKTQSVEHEEFGNNNKSDNGNPAENVSLMTLDENKNSSNKSATDDLMDSFLDDVLSSNNKQIHQEDFGSWTSNKNENQQANVTPIVAATPVVVVNNNNNNNNTGKKMSATQLALMMAKNQLKKD